MDNETDAPQGGAEAEAIAPEVETPSEATTEQQTEADETGQADDAGEATKEKKVPWFQKRIDEVTAKKYEAEREASYWKGIAEGRIAPQTQAQPEAEALPRLADFDYDEDKHAAALAKFFKDQAEKSIDERLTKKQQETSEQQKNADAIAKLKAGGEKFPDFVAAVSGLTATEAVRDFALADENAAQVLYELGKDYSAAERFNSLSPVQQAIELGKRAATPKAAAPKPIAPPPPETVAGIISGIGKTPEQMSMPEYAQWVKERDKT